jgi:hypothetical protein
MAGERHENGMVHVCVHQTQPHCVNKMGNTQSKPLVERHGRGTAWQGNGMAGERHENGMVCVNRPLNSASLNWGHFVSERDSRAKCMRMQ